MNDRSFRLRMAGLHTWGGLVCGWLLCAIFLTGSLSVFREPITRWMEAQPLAAEQRSSTEHSRVTLEQAARYLHEHAGGARFWRIQLPHTPQEAVRLTWREGSLTRQVALAPGSATPLPAGEPRQTEGGRHFMSFHYMLHLSTLGFWIVGALTVGFLVSLISGVVIHRRIFLDFFTFRPGRGPRAWLDLHNATAVLTLPFLLMIGYTGLSIFYTSYMPWPMHALYGADANAYGKFAAALSAPAPAAGPETGATPDWPALIQRAQQLTSTPAQMILVEHPATPSMTIKVIGRADVAQPSPYLFTPQASVLFDGRTGDVLQLQRAQPSGLSAGDQVYGVLRALHFADFGGWFMKWAYFFSGLLGMLMMAAGTLLFSLKRRIKNQHEFGSQTAQVYRVIEALNTTCLVGIGIACCAYLYANRLIPVELHDRALWERRAFALVWLATLVHALLRAPRNAWTEQLGFAALLCLGLPVLNHVTTGQDIWQYLRTGDWQRASVEGVSITVGIVLILVIRKLHSRRSGVK